jgi:hypothetical protein
VARNAIENAPNESGPLRKNQTTHAVAERPLYPRRLCFLEDKSDPNARITLYDVDAWMNEYNLVEHEMQYVFVAYTTSQFSHHDAEDIKCLHNIAKQAAIDAGVGAYWIGASCMSDDEEELEEDVFRISDVIRAAHSVVIAIKPSRDDAGTTERMLRNWGKRMWTLPEALLSPRERPLRIYSHSDGTPKLVKEVYKKNLAALIWDDSSMTRQLVDHYEGNLTLSRLELVILALRCLSNRETSRYLEGDMAYVLMGLLRQRPVVDRTDSEFQAFARLSLANDSDSLLERLICLLPQTASQQWYRTEDAYSVNLWDIQPTCQIAGVGENDTVILDGCYGASVQWEKFNAPWHCSRRSWKRLVAKCLLRIGAAMFVTGLLMAVFTGHQSPNPYSAPIAALIILSLPVFLAAPYIVSVVYGGKVWNVDPYFLGFEGYLDLKTIESNIYGAPMGRLSWSTAGSPLSRHHKNEFGECIGDDPTSDPAVADIVKQAKYTRLGQEKVFTLVDTREGLVTLFSAVRPPVAALICGQEGGMQRAVMVSLDHKRQTLYRETVLRMPTIVLERMYRTNRVRVGLNRPLDPTVLRSTIEH